MASKQTQKTGNVIVTVTNSMPLKIIGGIAGIAALGYGGSYVQNATSAPPTQRVENVQVADAATTEKLDKILSVVQETQLKVTENKGKIDAIADNQKEMRKRIDKNEEDIEDLEKK